MSVTLWLGVINMAIIVVFAYFLIRLYQRIKN